MDTTSSADAFLALTGRRQGAIHGECRVPGHADEIDVVAWRWGVSAPTALGTGRASGRRVHEPLVVTKRLDAASTKLMNALAANEALKSVALSLRKSGMDGDDYLTIGLGDARLVALKIGFADSGDAKEELTFSYRTITVTYHAQGADGSRGSASVFRDDFSAGA